MNVLLFSVLVLLLGSSMVYLFRLRRILAQLSEAIGRSRRVLPSESDLQLRRLGVAGLIHSYNQFADRYSEFALQNTGYSDQVDATLGAVQEAVIIYNSERIIEFANRSAEELFKQPRGLKGARVESALRSSSLLELLGSLKNESVAPLSQVSLEQDHQLLWFEASCARVAGILSPSTESTLVVLHDITKLKQLEEMRRDFIANVSHELRTPLTIIKGFAETLIEDDQTIQAGSRTRFLGKILTNAERLHVLVEDLLTLSRLESKPDQVELKINSLSELFLETAENYRRRIEDGDAQKILLDIDERVGSFLFDRYRMHQVLDNLVENAFRYATDFKTLTLQLKLDPSNNEVRCAVIDDGPGIPEKDLPHVFERFYRVDKGRSRDRGGTGLGLSITKHIVQQHGGRIYAESEPGKGAAIYFILPHRE